MKFQYDVSVVPVPPLTDAEALIRCIPGMQSVEAAGDGFQVVAVNRVGPIRLKMAGTATCDVTDPDRVSASVTLSDALAGTVYGTFVMERLAEGIHIDADITLGGRIGEFAQPLVRRKAEETVRGFQENLKRWAASR